MTGTAGAPPASTSTFQGCYRSSAVLVTGATGFKGSWLAQWLRLLGADVEDISLPPLTSPSLFGLAGLRKEIRHHTGDLRDAAFVADVVAAVKPRIVFHLAAQALVRASHRCPAETFATNVLGTVHVLEAIRRAGRPCAVVVVTSDKCYEDTGGGAPHEEGDRLGGRDPYSASKACAELVVSSYRRTFFPVERFADHGVSLASARAGNVVGPGDYADDRIVPDLQRALAADRPVPVRSPRSVRPWQHVLEPLSGYLCLGAHLLGTEAQSFCEAWNFGPEPDAVHSVRDVVEAFITSRGAGTWEHTTNPRDPYESASLRLDIAKARTRLAWRPVWDFAETMRRTAEGYRKLAAENVGAREVRSLLSAEIEAYERDARRLGLAWAVTQGERS